MENIQFGVPRPTVIIPTGSRGSNQNNNLNPTPNSNNNINNNINNDNNNIEGPDQPVKVITISRNSRSRSRDSNSRANDSRESTLRAVNSNPDNNRSSHRDNV